MTRTLRQGQNSSDRSTDLAKHWTKVLAIAGAVWGCQAPGPGPREEIAVIESALATPTFVQQRSTVPQSSQTTVAATFSAAQTAGNLNVVAIGWNNSTSTVSTVVDSKGNTYQLAIGPTRRTGALSQSIYYAKNIVAATANSNTVTVTFGGSTPFPDLRILEYSGIDRVNPLDVAAGNNGSGTTSSTSAVTTTFRSDLLVAANMADGVTTGAGTGYTSRVITSPNGDIVEDKVVTTAGSNTASAPVSPTGNWVMQMVAFRTLDNTAPAAPTNLVATAVSTTQINLTWTAATDDIAVTGYSVERCAGTGCTTFAVVGSPTTTSFPNSGLTGGTTYRYRVRATDAAGNFGPYSSIATAATQGCTTGSQCGTGFCADGVCCNTACNGGCGVCNAAGSVGTCIAKASGTPCRAAAGTCDAVETCNGTALTCPTNGFLAANTSCRAAAGTCDVAEVCTGTSAACPADAFVANGTNCSDNNACTRYDSCQAGACVGTVVACPGDACHPAGTCDTTSGLCSSPAAFADGTACDDGNRCTIHDACVKGTCIPESPVTGCTAATDTYYPRIVNLGSRQGVSFGWAINEAGTVVGSDTHNPVLRAGPGSIPSVGYRFTEAGGMQPLPQPAGFDVFPRGINASGVVTGTTLDEALISNKVFRHDPGASTLTILNVGTGVGMAINDAAQITGYGYFTGVNGARLYRALGGTVTQLTSPAGDLAEGDAIDAGGGIFGNNYHATGTYSAFRYTDALGYQSLNQLAPVNAVDWQADPVVGGNYLASAPGINGTQVVGWGYSAAGLRRGYIMTPASGSTPGTIKQIPEPSRFPPNDATHPIAPWDVNASGVVVGTIYESQFFYPQLAFAWVDGTGTVVLDDLIDPASGWQLADAHAINNNREVTGWGFFNGQPRAYKMNLPDLRPCPAVDSCHGPGVRDRRTGVCSSPVLADGTVCSDGNACTVIDRCLAGVCTGTNVTCPSDECHTAGTCNPTTGLCSTQTSVPDHTACDDRNSCTLHSECIKGTCIPEDPITGCTTPNASYYAPLTNLSSKQGSSLAMDINNNGQVAGVDIHYSYQPEFSFGEGHSGFVWTAAGGMTPMLQPSGMGITPNAINASGTVVGCAWDVVHSGNRSFRYTAATDTEMLPDSLRRASAINDAGQFTGLGVVSTYQAYRGLGSNIQWLPMPTGSTGTIGWGIDPAGSVAGSYSRANLPPVAFRYSDDNGLDILNQLVPAGSDWDLDPVVGNDFLTVGYGANVDSLNRSVIVGSGRTGNGLTRGFVMTLGPDGTPGSGTIKQIGLPSGVDPQLWVVPRRINRAGEVVGSLNGDGGATAAKAFIWVDGLGLTDLNTLVDPASGWVLRAAIGINDSRQVVGWGMLDGKQRAFKMTVPDLSPCPGADACHTVGLRNLRTGACPSPVAIPNIPACQEGISLQSSGVVDLGGGKFVAVFGFKNSGTASVRPTLNVESINGVPLSSPQPPPPTLFPVGDFAGAFLPTFNNGQTVTWTVDGASVSASTTSPRLVTIPIGSSGKGVRIGTTLVTIKPDIDQYKTPPAEGTVGPPPQLGDPYVGMLGGAFSVGPSGSANYTVPISIPPGIAGMAPNLSLVYNSQAGNGIAGQGWELTGLSVIHRCPKTRIQDGTPRQVIMDEIFKTDGTDSDGLCLDGERLFETSAGSRVFQAERTSFDKIEWVATLGLFRITTKMGEVRYYGSTADSIVAGPRQNIDPAVPPSTTASETAIWALSKVFDAWGNYYDVQYYPNPLISGLRVKEIDYTGHFTPPNLTPTVDPFSSVKFDYEPRTDVRNVRFRETIVPRNQRLTAITTPRGRYGLSYMANSPGSPSRLQTIDYACTGPSCSCTGATSCLKSLTFNWSSGGIAWTPMDNLGIPTSTQVVNPPNGGAPILPGTQYVDLDGDGRLDLVLAKQTAAGAPTLFAAWQNNGTGWTFRTTWQLPDEVTSTSPLTTAHVFLANSAGQATGVRFADIDGDGLPDLIKDVATVQPCTNGVCSAPVRLSPAVWLNRIKESGTWQLAAQFGTPPAGWPTLAFSNSPSSLSQVRDMNNDGRADLVRMGANSSAILYIDVAINNGSGWNVLPEFTFLSAGAGVGVPDLEDTDNDGVPDVVGRSYFSDATGAVTTSDGVREVIIGPGTLSLGPARVRSAPSGGTAINGDTHGVGDIDGDGVPDKVIFYHPTTGANATNMFFHYSMVGLGDGRGFRGGNVSGYVSALNAFAPTGPDANGTITIEDYAYVLADLNADGLVDLIRHHAQAPPVEPPLTGQVLYNTGETWKPLDNATGWLPSPGAGAVPLVPDESILTNGSELIDLNGDGVVDLTLRNRAWINSFKPPVITSFPNGMVVLRTTVHYDVISTATAQGGTRPTYSDSGVRDPGTTFTMLPVRVVQAADIDDGTGAALTTTYQYADLRGSAYGRGPQGFKSMTARDPTGTVVKTTFAQAYPYTGMPVKVEKWTEDATGTRTGPLSTTDTTYCDRIPSDDVPCTAPNGKAYLPKESLFVYPIKIVDTSYLRGSLVVDLTPPWITTTTEYVYDPTGNPQQTHVTLETSDGLQKITKGTFNVYSTPGSTEERMGKPTQTVVNTQRILPVDGHNQLISRTTRFQYRSISTIGGLVLTKSQVEPDAPESTGLRLDTAYDHDAFGNVITTTTCASDFPNCAPMAAGPATLPYRTTTASYNPAAFVAPAGMNLTTSIGYTQGRFPVKSTAYPNRAQNPAGQSEYFVYDPLTGLLLQKTGVNGITTCHQYDSFGNETSTTEQCGSALPLRTTIQRYLATTQFTSLAKVITVTTPPVGSPAWSYTDSLGRNILSLTRSFDGGLVETATEYDHFGRTRRVSKPFLTTEAPLWTTTVYDALSRPFTVTQDLGDISDLAPAAASTVTMTYQGMSLVTQQTVNGQARQRKETKNILAKVAEVRTSAVGDANEQVISFVYDADGNLVETTDPNGQGVHLEYDLQHRKTLSRDLDLGEWKYTYNGFGDLTSQVDGKLQTVTMTYDQIGRTISKTDFTGTAQWIYDVAPGAGIGKLAATISVPDARLSGVCTIPNIAVGIGNRAVRYFNYDGFGNVSEAFECADGETFSTQHVYDEFGRESILRYPTVNGARLSLRYNYNASGFLRFVGDDNDNNSVYWAVKSMNAFGQVTGEITRNGVETTSVRNASTSWLRTRTARAHADGDTLIQSWTNQFDEVGNLRLRARNDQVNIAASAETFGYDVWDRLTSSRVAIPTLSSYDVTESYGYDAIGNLISKNGKTYTYTGCMAGTTRAAGPHAVCRIDNGTPYTYDGNGNMLTGSGRTVTYNSANKSTHIGSHPAVSQGNDTGDVDIIYNADGHRVVEAVDAGSGVSARTLYVGMDATGRSIYERTVRGTVREHVHFLYAGAAHDGGAFALRLVTEDTSPASPTTVTRYHQFDHLGSVTAVSDEGGHVVSAAWGGAGLMGYDPWGARRAPEGRAATPASFDLPIGHRGFTGHESIPSVGLVNMNGRVYDPVVGRFLSPDSTVQDPNDLQTYNRYTYVGNNPLRYTDPTGYSWLKDTFYSSEFKTFIMVAATGACITGVGCTVALMIELSYSAAAAYHNGASFGQIALSTAIGIAAGQLGGALGSGITGAATDATSQMISGAISGAVSAAITTVAAGGGAKDAGWNALVGAYMGAWTAAMRCGYQAQTQVSVASSTRGGSGGERSEQSELIEASTRRSANDGGRTVVLYGNTTLQPENASGQPDYTAKDPVWRMSDENEDSFRQQLRTAIARKTGWSIQDEDLVKVSTEADVKNALAGSGIRRVAWVGHVYTMDSTHAFLGLQVGSIDGDVFAKALPAGATVAFFGCDSRALRMQIDIEAPGHSTFPVFKKGDAQIKMNFSGSEGIVNKVWFRPWIHPTPG